MRLVPRSLAGRLIVISTLTTLAALAFAAVGISRVLERFVIHGLDQQLDAQVTMLARAVRDDGTLDRARIVDLPVFERSGEGWGWQVESARGRWTGGDPIGTSRFRGLVPGPPGLPHPEASDVRPGEARTATGEPLHTRTLFVPTASGSVAVSAAGPRRLAVAPLREAMLPLLGSLAILGVVLGLAAVIQLRFGLRPLHALQASLAEVRAGRARHVPPDQPRELVSLVAELNALVDQNEAQLAHARRHVANLAHGLKTPLAALSVKLAERGDGDDLLAMVSEIDGRVRHHLSRARMVSPNAGNYARTELAPAIDDLVAVMQGIHADRAIAVTSQVAAGLAIVADPRDLDEMLGNLLDNAWRHARSTVSIRATPAEQHVRLVIEDDGPGLPIGTIAEALMPGRRLDERGDGHGFGLPIAQELAQLNGGELRLGKAELGGLIVTLMLRAEVLSR